MCQAEDAEDVQAAAVASEEAGAELAEFDEDIPWDEREAEIKRQMGEKTSKVIHLKRTHREVMLQIMLSLSQMFITVAHAPKLIYPVCV